MPTQTANPGSRAPDPAPVPPPSPETRTATQEAQTAIPLCATCKHCTRPPDGAASCAKNWPGRPDDDGYIVRCTWFSRRPVPVTLRRMSIEVPCSKRGRPGYRWTQGYVVRVGDGPEMFPPVLRREAYRMAREAGATSVTVTD